MKKKLEAGNRKIQTQPKRDCKDNKESAKAYENITKVRIKERKT